MDTNEYDVEHRLYRVSVVIDFEYAVVAESDEDACEHARSLLSDLEFQLQYNDIQADACLMAPAYRYPRSWDKDCVVYQSEDVSPLGKEMTLAETIEWEEKMLHEKARLEDFKRRQMPLFSVPSREKP